jgi:Fe-S oxidoreductase
VRFRKEAEIRKGESELRKIGGLGTTENIKILTSCPACLQGLSRFGEDLQNGLLEADYIVVEMANQMLGDQWLPDYVRNANNGGIERVLV